MTQKKRAALERGRRHLRPRPNLQVVTDAHVLRVEVEGTRAVGVRFRDKKGAEQLARAAREVVLFAGSYGSP